MTAAAYRRLIHAATFERSRFGAITTKMAKTFTVALEPTEADREMMRKALDAALKEASSGEDTPLLADKATAEEIERLTNRIHELTSELRRERENAKGLQDQVSLLDNELRQRDRDGAEALANQKAAMRYHSLKEWMVRAFSFRMGKLHAGLELLLPGLEGPNGSTDNVARKIIGKVDYEIGEILREGLEHVDHVKAYCAPKKTT